MKGRVPVVLSLVALVVSLLSLTQRGVAETLLPPHSVGTVQLRNGAVTAAKVKAHSLLARNFKHGQLPAGPRGLPGAPGPSDAYSASLVGPAPVAVRDTPATLAELEIPQAGNYVIEANAYFESNGTGIATLTCVLDTLEGAKDEVRLLAGNPTPVALSVVHTYEGLGAVDLSCAGRAPADAYSIRITAIRVGTLTDTGLAPAKAP